MGALGLNLQVFNGRSSSNHVLPANELSNNSTSPTPDGGGNWTLGQDMTIGFSLAAFSAGADYKQPALRVPVAANASASLQVLDVIPTFSCGPGRS